MVSHELEVKYNDHIEGRNATKIERNNDRKGAIHVLCFDMQNVLSCPLCFYPRNISKRMSL
jgi:hypothetical protein